MTAEADPKVRHEFVGMMFAVAIGEVGVQTAALVHYGISIGFLPVYLHLVLASVIIAASWVGWTLTPTKEAKKDLTGVLRKQFCVLLLDVLLVILYFILARAMNTTAGDTDSPHYTFSAEADAFWLILIFWCYLFWDFLTKGIKPFLLDPNAPDDVKGPVWRKRISIACAALSIILWVLVRNVDPPHVCCAELAMICLVLLFRALKELASAKWPPPTGHEDDRAALRRTKPWAMGWSWTLFVALAILTLCARYMPLPSELTGRIQSAFYSYGPVTSSPK